MAVGLTSKEESGADQRVNILVVDDQPENLLATSAILEPLGQNIVTAASGSEALWRLLTEEYALILLDVQMPAMDGFEMAALARAREKSRAIPIIFMTGAYASEASVFQGYEVGAVDYILKPVIPEILRSKVAVFIDLAKKTELIRRQTEALLGAEKRRHAKEMEDALAFSHAVSHDLRTPLRHIQSFSEILVESYADRLDEQGRDYLKRLSGAAQKMMRLIEAMLQLSQATRGDIQREIIDLSRIAAELESELRRGEPDRCVEFNVQRDVTAIGDPQLLRLVMENLLRNAWKYTRKKQRARIEFGTISAGDEPTYFVRDDGVGFDMAHADKLFAPFQRLHPRGEFEGTGIGLATVRRIVQRHGGSVWADAKVGQGAAFFFSLPSRKPA